MLLVIAIISTILSIFTGYTMVTQGTTLALGRLLTHDSSPTSGTGLQDAITPKMQTIRNIVVIISFVLMFIVITFTYAWYHALWVLVLVFMASTAFPIIIGMRAGSNRIVSVIVSDMKKRSNAHLESGDELRSNAINDLINRIEKIPEEQIMREVKR